MEQIPTNKTKNKVTGAYGEQITARYYESNGYEIIGRNYLKKWGEIDVIAKIDTTVHFIEVKAVSYERKQDLRQSVAHGTWRPEENVHASKLKKLARTIETWLTEHNWAGDWQIDVAAVRLVPRETYATIKIIPNIIIE